MFNHPVVTLTGITHENDAAKARELALKYDFLEWGILYSPTRVGGRYAARNWIMNNDDMLRLSRKALHLCGQAVPMFLNNNSQVTDMLEPELGVRRVQLNFNIIKTPIDLAKLDEEIQQYPWITFITQHNNSNKNVYKQITASNHQVLFDQSGGNGVSPKAWKKPLKNKICGYAGGLGPGNIHEELGAILSVSPKAPQDFWIDMESKLRINDKLDLIYCELVLQSTEAFCYQHCKKVEIIGF